MKLSDLKISSALMQMEPSFYAEALRLRPNYLIYTLCSELSSEQKTYLAEASIPWAEYSKASTLEALMSFLKSIHGGLYLPEVASDLELKQSKVCVFLLDPHLIEAFEAQVSQKRQGVLIRRHLIASHDFKETIDLRLL